MATARTGQQSPIKRPPAVTGVVKFYQEGAGNVWDKLGHTLTLGAPQHLNHHLSQAQPSPPTPRVPKSVDDSTAHTATPFLYLS